MDNTVKFSGKAESYVSGRPEYSPHLIDYLYEHYISQDSIVADIGCGTGKFTKHLLNRGSIVYGVEPNGDMRDKAVKELSVYSNFHVINGDASNTGLKDDSVDFVTAAQAFHWFDIKRFYSECLRIMRKGSCAALIWNVRDMSAAINRQSYDVYKKYCPQFQGFSGGIKEDDIKINEFFNGKYEKLIFDNPLVYSKEKFINRSLSGSYSLSCGDELYSKYIRELEQVFDNNSTEDRLVMPNCSIAYIGKIK